ncbi:zinc finger protein 28-like [Oppia nitens]|uniref:zinc finger protein 28-like n=1 Tax=Oppia nitens TaxID=1686743 RepID=UPI0023DA1365|nr:zinc finger protein 28-like [Oppia nitens]
MNQSNDNIKHNTRLRRHGSRKTQDTSVTIDVNDVFEEVVKQNERLVKEIEFYEEVVNDLVTNMKTCIVCQQNNVIKDRISELETHLNSKTIDNSTDFKSEYNKLKPRNVRTNGLEKSKKKCVKDFTDSDSYISCETSDDNDSDNSRTTNIKTKTLKKEKNTPKRRDEDLRDVDNKQHSDKTNVSTISEQLSDERESDIKMKTNVKTKSMTTTKKKLKIEFKTNNKIIFKDIDEVDNDVDRSESIHIQLNSRPTVKKPKIKPYSDEYEVQRKTLKVKSLTSDGRYQCQFCDYVSNKVFGDLEAHFNGHHLMIKPFKCNLCSKLFKSLKQLLLHLKVKHYGIGEGLDQLTDQQSAKITKQLEKFKCKLCNKCLYCARGLENHVLRVHHNQMPPKLLACDRCNKSYSNDMVLARHRSLQHGIGKSWPLFYCDWKDCQYKTHNKTALESHKKIHLGIRDYVCDWPGCDYRAVAKQNLEAHQLVHSAQLFYQCQWSGCQYGAKRDYDLKRHVKRVHEDIPRALVCHWPGCDKTFRFNRDVKRHMLNHKEPHIPCPYCSKMFKTNKYLQQHLRSHRRRLT